MACSDYTEYLKFWLEGQFADAVLCPYQETLTQPLFALLVFAPIGLSLYIYSDSISLPLSLTIIVGGVVIPHLPSPAIQLAGIAAILAITIAGFLAQDTTGRPL